MGIESKNRIKAESAVGLGNDVEESVTVRLVRISRRSPQ